MKPCKCKNPIAYAGNQGLKDPFGNKLSEYHGTVILCKTCHGLKCRWEHSVVVNEIPSEFLCCPVRNTYPWKFKKHSNNVHRIFYDLCVFDRRFYAECGICFRTCLIKLKEKKEKKVKKVRFSNDIEYQYYRERGMERICLCS